MVKTRSIPIPYNVNVHVCYFGNSFTMLICIRKQISIHSPQTPFNFSFISKLKFLKLSIISTTESNYSQLLRSLHIDGSTRTPNGANKTLFSRNTGTTGVFPRKSLTIARWGRTPQTISIRSASHPRSYACALGISSMIWLFCSAVCL